MVLLLLLLLLFFSFLFFLWFAVVVVVDDDVVLCAAGACTCNFTHCVCGRAKCGSDADCNGTILRFQPTIIMNLLFQP